MESYFIVNQKLEHVVQSDDDKQDRKDFNIQFKEDIFNQVSSTAERLIEEKNVKYIIFGYRVSKEMISNIYTYIDTPEKVQEQLQNEARFIINREPKKAIFIRMLNNVIIICVVDLVKKLSEQYLQEQYMEIIYRIVERIKISNTCDPNEECLFAKNVIKEIKNEEYIILANKMLKQIEEDLNEKQNAYELQQQQHYQNLMQEIKNKYDQ